MPGRSEGEGLAGPSPPHDQGDAGTALAEVAHHALLVLASRGVCGQGGLDGLVAGDDGLVAGAADRRVDQPLLCGQ